MRVVAQHNLWFEGRPRFRNYRLQGKSMLAVVPRLGLKSSDNRQMLRQEMQWLHRYTGRDGGQFNYSLEWISPYHLIDRNLNEIFLPEIEQTRARWHIFYDPVLAVRNRGLSHAIPVDFSKSKIAQMFRSDLDYMWSRYFNLNSYWHLRDKPVLYFWAVASAVKNVGQVLSEAQQQGVYVLGEVFGSPNHPPPVDGLTGFVASTPELQGLQVDVPTVLPIFRNYYEQHDGVAAFDRESRPDLIPAMSCQYDDTNFRSIIGGPQTRILANDRNDVEDFLRLAGSFAKKIDGQKYVWIGTTNNWAEGSTLLPTADDGPRFLDSSSGLAKIGNYGYEHLKAVRNVFFQSTREYTGPSLQRQAGGSVKFVDCDVLGKLRVKNKAKVDNPPNWMTKANLKELKDFEWRWQPENPRGVQLRFKNLDGLQTTLEVNE